VSLFRWDIPENANPEALDAWAKDICRIADHSGMDEDALLAMLGIGDHREEGRSPVWSFATSGRLRPEPEWQPIVAACLWRLFRHVPGARQWAVGQEQLQVFSKPFIGGATLVDQVFPPPFDWSKT
jgi:hypothetical protein